MAELEKIELQISPGRTKIFFVPKGTKVQKDPLGRPYRSGIAQFKPLQIKHGTKEGSPMLHSRKEANQWLKQNRLISPLFSD